MDFSKKLVAERKAVLLEAKRLQKRAAHLAHAIRAVARLEGQSVQRGARKLSKKARAAIAAGQRKRWAAAKAKS